MPVAQIQFASGGVVITLATHVADLSSDVTDARLDSATSFTATLAGVVSSPLSPTSASATTGLVTRCTLTPSGSDVAVAITLSKPVSSFQTVVASGDIVQFTFS